MATCLLCKKDVTSGYVVCGEYSGKLKPGDMPPVLNLFAAWLGTEITRDKDLDPCTMCRNKRCWVEKNGSTCRMGVAAWFRAKAEQFCNQLLEQSVIDAANQAESKHSQVKAVGKLVDANIAKNGDHVTALVAQAVSAAAERAEEV